LRKIVSVFQNETSCFVPERIGAGRFKEIAQIALARDLTQIR